MSKEQAQQHKSLGNTAFTSGDYQTAITEFTKAIECDPTDAIFYSNRSGAYASLQQYEQALEDASKCVQLKPEFAKGYSRQGVALFHLGRYEEAKSAYEAGLKLDANNEQLKEGLNETEKKLKDPMGKLFGPDMWTKLMTDPTTREFMNDPSFMSKMKQIQQNPQLFTTYMSDKKVQQALGVLFGMGAGAFRTADPGSDPMEDVDSGAEIRRRNEEEKKRKAEEEKKKQEEAERKKKEEEELLKTSPEFRAKKDAEAEKVKGNDAYKNRRFDEAILHYNKAIELSPSIVFYNNLAAVYYEKKEYDTCIKTCEKGIELGREQLSDYSDIAKAFARIGNAYNAQNKLNEAIEYYNKSLLEKYDDKVKMALRKAEDIKKKLEAEAYLDPAKSEEHKQKGNALYSEAKYVDAIAEYTEALKRDPTNYKVYSNRAACYTKLMDWQRGLEDCDRCISVDPSFSKAYIRKGKIQHFLKQYHKALETFEKAEQLEPNSTELMEAKRATIQAINAAEHDPEAQKQRAAEAMKDPEIQAILRDPMVNKVLMDMQQDPQAGAKAMRDPDMRKKIEKLIAAGVLAVK